MLSMLAPTERCNQWKVIYVIGLTVTVTKVHNKKTSAAFVTKDFQTFIGC